MISYHNIDTKFKLPQKREHSKWLKEVISSLPSEQDCFVPGNISIIFCSDSHILSVNNQYLKHNYYTDIITFDYSDNFLLSGDLFIAIDTVKDNSLLYNTSFNDELHRVIVHGILHLAGYKDDNPESISLMRQMEEHSLLLRNHILKNLYD